LNGYKRLQYFTVIWAVAKRIKKGGRGWGVGSGAFADNIAVARGRGGSRKIFSRHTKIFPDIS
jgi:hypothetical protein